MRLRTGKAPFHPIVQLHSGQSNELDDYFDCCVYGHLALILAMAKLLQQLLFDLVPLVAQTELALNAFQCGPTYRLCVLFTPLYIWQIGLKTVAAMTVHNAHDHLYVIRASISSSHGATVTLHLNT